MASFNAGAEEGQDDRWVEVPAGHPVIRLSEEAFRAFHEALERPASASERLAQALRRPRRFRWID